MKLMTSIRRMLPSFGRSRSMDELVRIMSAELDTFTTGSGIVSSHEAWRRSSYVRMCITKIASSISELPFELYRGSTKIEKHPLLDLIANPNPDLEMTTEDLFLETIIIRQLRGECFWLLDRDGGKGKVPGRIWLYHPDAVTERLTPDKRRLLGWALRDPDGRTYFADRADVIQFKIVNPDNRWRGQSPLESAGLAVSSDLAAQRYNHDFFRRGAVPGTTYETAEDIDDETAQRLLDVIKMYTQGKGHTPLLLHSGVKLSSVQPGTAKDAEFVSGRSMNRQEIMGVFGVPPVMLGLYDQATFANAKEQTKIFWQQTNKPIAKSIANAIHRNMLLDPSLSCVFNMDGVEELREALKEKIDSVERLTRIGVPYNVAEKLLDIGTGPIPGGQTGMVSFGLVPLADAAAPLPEADPVAPTVDGPGKPAGDVTAPDAGIKTELTLNGAQLKEAVNILLQVKNGEIDPVAAIELLVGAGLTHEAAEKMVAATKVDPPAPEPEPVAAPAQSDLDRFAASIMRRSLPRAARAAEDDPIEQMLRIITGSDGKLEKIIMGYAGEGWTVGANQMAKLLGVTVNFDLKNPAAKKFLEAKQILIRDINATTEAKVRKIIEGIIEGGKTVADASAELRGAYNFSASRSKVIARTEISQAVSGARYGLLEQEGADKHEWLDSNDERTREDHSAEDGNIVALGETFPVTGLVHPCEVGGDPSQVINCRCVSLPAASSRSLLISGKTAREAHWRATIQQTLPLERRLTKSLQKFFFEQRTQLLKALADSGL